MGTAAVRPEEDPPRPPLRGSVHARPGPRQPVAWPVLIRSVLVKPHPGASSDCIANGLPEVLVHQISCRMLWAGHDDCCLHTTCQMGLFCAASHHDLEVVHQVMVMHAPAMGRNAAEFRSQDVVHACATCLSAHTDIPPDVHSLA